LFFSDHLVMGELGPLSPLLSFQKSANHFKNKKGHWPVSRTKKIPAPKRLGTPFVF